ncbi:MAG: single-stranded DNA-binding protein [Dongiaceae bacterium]
MPSFSQVHVLGYIGNEVQIRAGKKANYLHLSIGVTKAFKSDKRQKDWETRTKWVKVMIFGPYSIYVADRVKKGDLIHVIGEIEISKWEKEGKIIHEMYVLGNMVIPIITSKKEKVDVNYGLKAEEVDSTQIPF